MSVHVRSCVLMQVLSAVCVRVFVCLHGGTETHLEKKYGSLVKFETTMDCINGGRFYWLTSYQLSRHYLLIKLLKCGSTLQKKKKL